jgi:hypothetical protein
MIGLCVLRVLCGEMQAVKKEKEVKERFLIESQEKIQNLGNITPALPSPLEGRVRVGGQKVSW